MRKIIHIDMDAFFASVEQRDDPSLRGKAIAVGGSPSGRGVVMTASYEARKFGVRSAMPSLTAKRLCPHLTFVRPRMEAYKAASEAIRAMFYRYTDLVEPLSLDEAYLDVTENKRHITSAIAIAREIKVAILTETGLSATAGVSFNKFLAKMASGHQKPDGLNFISREIAQNFIDALPIHKFHGIGEKTAERMKALGIHNGATLREQELKFLTRHFGKMGHYFHQISHGIDDRAVIPDRQTKSISVEDTFSEDVDDLSILDAEIERLTMMLHPRFEKYGLFGRTLTLKVKYADFQLISRSESRQLPFRQVDEIAECAKILIRKTEAESRKVRLIGIGVSNFGNENKGDSESGQLTFRFGED
jgi:DNA polymerase-4